MKIVECSSCKAQIFFAVTKDEKPMPIDRDPVPLGTVEIEAASDPRDPPRAHMLDRGGFRRLDDGTLHSPFLRYRPHFVTCPFAAQHRKVKS